MSKKSVTTRDKAVAHYNKAFEDFHGEKSEVDLSGVPTQEIWNMGDTLITMANEAAMAYYDEFVESATDNGGATLADLMDS